MEDPAIDDLELDDMLHLRESLSEALLRRFERGRAIAFSDVVGSTGYFAEFGDEAGRGLLQRHIDLLGPAIARHGGWLADTAGDGALTCFDAVDGCVAALIELEEMLVAQNQTRAPEHHLRVRCGVHWGPVLTDGVVVTGDAVNLAARVTSTAGAGEIRLTRAAAERLPPRLRERGRALPPVSLKGIPRPVELVVLQWRDANRVPGALRIEETGVVLDLPKKPTVTLGRLREHAGAIANDIVLALPDRDESMKISRWHVELRREDDGLYLHPVSEQATEVDGRPIAKGERRVVVPGTVVRLSEALTMTFLDEGRGVLPSDSDGD